MTKKGMLCLDLHGIQHFVGLGEDVAGKYDFAGCTWCLHRAWFAPSGKCLRLYLTGGIETVPSDVFEAAEVAANAPY
eukprot:1697652-Amphidinium_carterae.1